MLRLRLPLALLLLLAAAVTAGIVAQVSLAPPAGAVRDRTLPENSYLEVRHRIRDLRGELLYEVDAERLDQYADRQALSLSEPRISWLDPAYRNSFAAARRGEIREFQLSLSGDVELLLDAPGRPPAIMLGDSLTLDAQRERVRSEQAVVISQSRAVMRGAGLDYRLDGAGGRLHRDVRVRQFGPAAPEPSPLLLERILDGAFRPARAAEEAGETLDLSANRMEWDAQAKLSVYYGEVRATQGDMVLEADKLSVRAEGARVHSLHAEGNARWSQTTGSGRPLRARAGSILYQVLQRKAFLKSDVSMQLGEHRFTGDQVTYLLDEERIETPTTPKPGERVRLRLQTAPEDPS